VAEPGEPTGSPSIRAAASSRSRTHIGVTSVDGYHSVATGKLTTAPLFGVRAAQRALFGNETP
jgi:hypothetical protein